MNRGRLSAFKPLGLWAFFSFSFAASSAQTPAVPGPTTGLSSVAVQVVEDATGRPIKGATVTAVVIGDATYVKNTITDRAGRAFLLGLSKGRVRVSSGHSGFLSSTYGAERPGEDGTYITIGEVQQVPAITIRLKRGGVIAGTITSDAGEPMAGVNVQVFRRSFSGGGQVFSRAQEADFTDDRGAYRIRNLVPGDYLVGVVPRTQAETVTGDIGGTNADDPTPYGDPANPRGLVLADFGDGRIVMSGDTEPLPLPLGDGRLLAYSPTFYPGTAAAAASIITIGAAELRDGIDFHLDPVPVVRVPGRLVGLGDGTLMRATMALVPVAEGGRIVDAARHLAVTDSSATFIFGSVPRGQYVLEVRANENIVNATPMWASVPLAVGEGNLTDLVVPLNEGTALSGQIQFASSAVESAVRELKGVQVTLTRALPAGASGSPSPRALLTEDGRFMFRNLAPGEYIARPEGLPYGWLASSAMLDGRDILDFGLRVQPGVNIDGLVMTITDRLPEVTGVLRDATDRPATSGWVVLFPDDKSYWTGTGRRLQGVRPGTDGRFVFRSVPPGAYLLVAADVETGQWLDPAFLEKIAPRAMRIVVREGETPTGIVLRK